MIRREALFPQLINELDIKIGVEVGVAGGLHSVNILSHSNIEKLYCIDPYPDDLYWAKEKDGDRRYEEAQKTLAKWIGEGRAELIRKTGLEVVNDLEGDIEFVYMDGDRSPDVYPKEMEAWMKKIKMGGILSGHDYKNKRGFTVKTMVDKFCEENNYALETTTERCKSWYFIKTH